MKKVLIPLLLLSAGSVSLLLLLRSYTPGKEVLYNSSRGPRAVDFDHSSELTIDEVNRLRPYPHEAGDADRDSDVDDADFELLMRELGFEVGESLCGFRCDLDRDGRITDVDGELLKERCTRQGCSVD